MTRLLLLAAAPLALAAAPAVAQDQAAQPDIDKDRVTIGAAAVTVPDYEGSAHNEIAAAPVVLGSVGGFAFQVVGNHGSIDLIPNPKGPSWDIQAGPIAYLNLDRQSVKGIDDPRVRALGKVGTGIELGGYVGLGKTGVITSAYDKLSVSVSYRHDVNGASDGQVWTPTLSYLTPLSHHAAVGLSLAGDWADSKYARTYFGVTPAGAVASGLPVFTPRSGWKDYTLSGFAGHSLTGDLTHGLALFAGGAYRRLLNDFGDSPIVRIAGSRNQWTGALGLAYTF